MDVIHLGICIHMDVFGVVHVSCSTFGLKRNCFPCPHIGGMCKEARQWDYSPKRCSFGTGVFYDLRLGSWVILSCYILLDLIKLSFIWVQLWNQSADLPTSEEIANWNKILLWRSSVHLLQPRILQRGSTEGYAVKWDVTLKVLPSRDPNNTLIETRLNQHTICLLELPSQTGRAEGDEV